MSGSWTQASLRRQRLTTSERDCRVWHTEHEDVIIHFSRTALLLCDVWDRHWCPGAERRLELLAPVIAETVRHVREKGTHVIHSPSDTVDSYANHPARQRMLEIPRVEPPEPIEHDDPALPIDDADGGCDAPHKGARRVWSSQHPEIVMDPDCDVISDDGVEVYSYLRHHEIELLMIAGVHTNMCVLNRSFGIKAMVGWGVNVVLVRDLTDAMYDPARPPYVSHDHGTQLVVEYVEKFWCPTLRSAEITR